MWVEKNQESGVSKKDAQNKAATRKVSRGKKTPVKTSLPNIRR